MSNRNKKQINLRVDPDDYELLVEAAEENDMSLYQYMATQIEKVVKKLKKDR